MRGSVEDRVVDGRNRQGQVAQSGGLPGPIKERMESAFGADFSRVRIHEDGEAGKVGAEAFTRGNDLHFAPGRFQPDTEKGQQLIGHELAHVVQQSQGRVSASFQAKGLAINDDADLEAEADAQGARAARGEKVANLGREVDCGFGTIAQCYFEQKISKKDWRVSDDLKMAIRQDTSKPAYGSHAFFADPALITSSSVALKLTISQLELEAGSETMTVTDGKTSRRLSRVIPKNLQDGSKGNRKGKAGMQWPEDCGKAANAIMHSNDSRTKGVFHDPNTGTEKTTKTLMYGTYEKYRGTEMHTPHLMLDEILKATLDPDPKKAREKYQKMSPSERDDFDKKVGINKYADPGIGEAYSMVPDKDELVEDKASVNFHWAGVCMKSGGDHVTMENFVRSGPTAWDFQMYGSASKPGQTFHEQQAEHTDSRGQDEYGAHPTTIEVRP